MMKLKIFGGMLVTVAVLASVPAMSYAGGGGFGGGPLTGVFLSDCYKVQGGFNPAYTLDIMDQFGNHQTVKIGQAQVVCVSSGDWMRSPSVDQAPLNPNFDPLTNNAAKCYDVSAPGDGTPGTTATVTDIFASQTGALKKMSMVCVPATVE